MDNQVRREGRLIVLVDKAWREDIQNLPFEDISVPVLELPDPEPDNCNPLETLKEQEQKWTDLALNRINSDQYSNTATSTQN